MRLETFIWKDSPNMFDEFADLFNKAKTVYITIYQQTRIKVDIPDAMEERWFD